MDSAIHKLQVAKAPYGYAFHKIIVDHEGKPVDYEFIEVNHAFEKLTGLKSHDLLGKTIMNIMPEIAGDTFDWIGFYGEIALNGGENEFEQYSDTLKRWYTVNVYSPEKYYFVTTFFDITVRKNTEQALKETEERYRVLLKGSILGILAFDIETHQCSFFNSAACRLFGYSEEEITELNLAAFHPKDSIEMVLNEFEAQGRGEKSVSNSLPCLRKDGTIFYADIAGYSTLLHGRDCSVGFIMDVTERRQNEESLHQTRLFLDSIIEHSPNAMWISDEHGTLIRLNQAFRDNLHVKDDEVVGKYNILHDNQLEDQGFMPMVKDVFQKGLTARFIIQYDTSSINNLHLERTINVFLDVHISPIVNSQGKVTNAIIQHNDITELKMVEQALAESKERYRVLLNGSSYGILATDIETHRFLFSNPAICKLFGYTDEEFQQLSIVDLVPKESRDLVMKEFELQMRGEKSISFAQACKRKDGTVFYADIAGSPIVLNGRECSVGFFIDVTARQQAQESLKESESALRQAQEIAMMGSWELDLINQKAKWSENCFILYGLHPFEMEPTFEYFRSRVHPDDLHLIDETFVTISRFKKPTHIEVRILFPDGTDKWSQINIAPVVIKGELVALKGVQIDITALKRIEFELIKAKEKAEESDRLKSAFLSNMSHEIRTPMNGIMGFTELLKEPQLTGEEQQAYIRIIQKSGKRMLNIIKDLVDISKIEAGQMTVVVKESNINEQIEELFHFFKPETERKGIALSFKNHLQSGESVIATDQEKIYAILTNLIKNAIKYTKHGSIVFGYAKKGEFLEFFVKDTGIGIPKHRQEAIFNRFVQADIADINVYEGAGLGLSIAKAYVEMLGGKIWVVSIEGEGSIFYFTIPYCSREKPKSIHQEIQLHPGTLAHINRLKILVVEDDLDSQFILKAMLKPFGKEILIASNGIEALETFSAHPDIDLIMMDIRIPGIDGIDLTRQIRKSNPYVIIIAQTAYAIEGDKAKAIEAGCNDYVSKPIIKDELFGLMHKYCSA